MRTLRLIGIIVGIFILSAAFYQIINSDQFSVPKLEKAIAYEIQCIDGVAVFVFPTGQTVKLEEEKYSKRCKK